MFTPHGVSVLNQFSRTMTTLIEEQNIGRNGLGIEKMKACYNVALDQLIVYIPLRTHSTPVISEDADVPFNSKLTEEKLLLGVAGDGDGKEKETKTDCEQ